MPKKARADRPARDALTARRLVLFHTMDPRGTKLGGIETHVRLVLSRHPDDLCVLFVGIDEIGDLVLGQSVPLEFEGRWIEFLPIVCVRSDTINAAAKTILSSTTLRYTLGLLRHFAAIRRIARKLPASSEIERFEFALVPKLMGLPLVVLVHNEGTGRDEMDSLLKKYWFLHRFNERLALILADRVFAVNSSIAERVTTLSARLGAKTEVMSVSVDTDRFAPTPFLAGHDSFHVCFAGRLDAFKDPALMFAALARLNAMLEDKAAGRFRRVVFEYVGASDPHAIDAFAAIAERSVQHGIRSAAEVATIMRAAHAGIITSFFEGMPCYLLEMMASGRPVGAIRLPQFAPLILPGVTGFLVDRRESLDASAQALAEAFFDLAIVIDAGRLEPDAIAACVEPYSVDAQLHRLFACHEALAASQRRHDNESINAA